MWLSRFSREFASWRANGINAEISADRRPRFRSCSSRGTASLIPTPSSAVSHIKTPQENIGVMESGVLGPKASGTHYSITPLLQFYRQFLFTHSTISHRLANQTSGNDLAYLIHSS